MEGVYRDFTAERGIDSLEGLVVHRRCRRISYEPIVIQHTTPIRHQTSTIHKPITLLNIEGTAGGGGVVTGLGVALQGSRPSYDELERGLSSTKLAPRFVLYRTPGRGALNIFQTQFVINKQKLVLLPFACSGLEL